MRKKTGNEDLARRAKNLIKKWKVSVMNGVAHNDSNSRPNSRAGSRESNNITNSHESSGKKRKRTSGVDSPVLNHVNKISRMAASAGSSPRLKSSSPRPNKQTSNKKITPKTSSPLIKTPNDGKRNKPNISSPLHNHSAVSNTQCTIEKNDTKLNVNTNIHSNLEKPIPNIVLNNKVIDNGHHHHHVTENSIVPKHDKDETLVECIASDTRVQENRISSYDSGYQGTLSCEESTPTNSVDLDDKVFKPIMTPTSCTQQLLTSQNQTSPSAVCGVPQTFEPIAEEDLCVNRRELPEDMTAPDTPADGVNGVYNDNSEFCDWTDEVVWRDKDYHILPYVILD